MKTLRLLLLLAILSAAHAAPGSRPNIVLILADDLGWADLAGTGNRFHDTPHLDRLAGEGVRFTAAYAASPLCMPSRAAILTGKHPARLGLTDVNPGRMFPFEKLIPPPWALRLEPAEVTLAERLRAAGYATASIGKWHLGRDDAGATAQGFELDIAGTHLGYPPSFFSPYKNPALPDGPPGEHLDERLGREAAAFVARPRDRPFFLFFAPFAVHLPIQPRPDLLEKYRARLRDAPADGAYRNPHYAAMVETLDASVGAVLAALHTAGVADDTLVVFTSDNGGLSTPEGPHTPATSNAPLRSGKGHLYEGGLRVPLLVRWPGVAPAGADCAEPVIGTDLFFTLAAAAGLDVSDVPPDGLDLAALLRAPGSATLPRSVLCWHFPHYSRQGSEPSGAIRRGPEKLIEFFGDARLELHDLRDDPGEARNLATARPERAEDLRAALAAWRKSVGAREPAPNPAHDPARRRQADYWGVELRPPARP